MTKLFFIFLLSIMFTACAHTPKCGNPEGARTVYFDDKDCRVRIRQVTIGSEMKIPQSLKDGGLAAFDLKWVEPALLNGQISLGHFILVPKLKEKVNE